MRALLFWALLALAASPAVAQGTAALADDHLVPPASSLTEPAYATRYYTLLRERLGLDSAAAAQVLVVVRPSFAPEYALWVEQRGLVSQLVYRVAQRSIWGNSNRSRAAPPVPGAWPCRPRWPRRWPTR